MNWCKGIRRFWIAASLLWVIGLIATDYALHPIGERITGGISAGTKDVVAGGADSLVSCSSTITTNCRYRPTAFELLYDLVGWKIKTLWLYAVIPPMALLGLIGISTWVYRGFVGAKVLTRSPSGSTAYPVRRGHRRFQSWRNLGHALRREFRRLTRRREITPKMVFTAIVAAALGWLLAGIANNWPQTPPQ